VADADIEPDDLVQEALVRVLQKGSLDELRDPGSYLRRAIINLGSNERRRLGRWRSAARRLGPETEERPNYPSDLADLQSLDPIDRAALYLTQVEGLSADEAGLQLGLSANAVNLRVSRSRRRLRSRLQSESNVLDPSDTALGTS
jgi:RNA polymerase sigma-70 factor (ECF subfamily)